MDLVDKKSELVSEDPESIPELVDSKKQHEFTQPTSRQSSIDVAVCLLANIAETACEHHPSDQGLLRFANYIDLYGAYLQMARNPSCELRSKLDRLCSPSTAVITQQLSSTGLVSFERFVRDSRLIDLAASYASQESGELVSPPPPLASSANN